MCSEEQILSVYSYTGILETGVFQSKLLIYPKSADEMRRFFESLQ